MTAITGVPEAMIYRESDHVVVLGDGEFGPVSAAVWEYTVGGRNILSSWFNYRKKEPGGRRSSPLDHIHETSWPADWTTEFIDLLTVLTRLVALEVQQADLLDRVLGGPLRTRGDLEQSGVHWPAEPKDRAVRNPLSAPTDDPTFEFD